MKRIILTSLILLSVLSGSSFAMDWIIVPGAKTDGDMVCLDRDDVSKRKGVITAWLKRFKEGGNYTKTLMEFDCSKKQSRTLKSVEFDKPTSTTTTIDFEPVWEVSAPETPASAATAMICRKGKGINPALVSMKQLP